MALLPFMSQAGVSAAGATDANAATAGAGTQAPATLAEMTRLLGGDLSGSLTSGDKLLALSGLLRSATRSGRRAGLTPQQVIGDIRQQKLAELQNRMAVEQMRVKMAQEQQLNAAWQDYVARQPDARRAKLAGIVDPQERQKMLAAEPKPFQLTRSGGTQYMVFTNPDGTATSVPLSIPRDVETMQINKGDKILIVDKNTNETIREYDVKMNPAQVAADEVARANLAIRRAEAARPRGGGGGGSSKQPVQITVDGQTTFGVPLGGFRYQLQDGRTVTATPAKSSSSSFVPQLPPAGAGPRFR